MSTTSIGNLNDNYFSIDFAGKTDPIDTYRFNRPNTGSFRVTAEGFSSVVGMQLLDSDGKVVKDIETNGTNSGTFSIDNLGATNYALKISAPSRDTNYQVSLTPDGKVDPLTGLGVDSGFFATDSTGQVGFDWLHDGGNYQGEVAIFSVQGMEKFTPGSQEFTKEAARRALSNSNFGHVILSDSTEGANPLFNGGLGEANYNSGPYSGPKTFAMKPGEAFAVMLVPNGTVQDVFNNPNVGGDKRPLLSLSSTNPDDAWLYGQIADVNGTGKAFAMEDQRVDQGSDKDYNDLVFKLTGATGKAVSIDKVINPSKDWTKLDGGKKLIEYVTPKPPVATTPPVVVPPTTPPVVVPPTTPPVVVPPTTPPVVVPPVAVTPPAVVPPTIPPVAVTPPAVVPPTTLPAVVPPVVVTPPVAIIPPVAIKPPIAPTTPSEPPAIDPQPPVTEQPPETQPPVETIVPPAVDRTFVGIIDTGFAAKNPDLDYSKVTLGRDRIDKDSNPLLNAGEGNEHGTFSWGLVSAIQGNDIGIDGYNDQANVYLSRAIGSGEWDLALTDFVSEAKGQKKKNAIALLPLDLTQKNADGSITTRYEFTARERAALENARQSGVLLVVAAGNDGSVMSVLGQASQEFDNIITVGSSNGVGRSDYSSYGYGLDILVPGGSIDNPTLSTVGDDVGQMAGTSASAAIAAGMLSKVWESNPALNATQVIDILTGSAIDLKEPGWDKETGFGVVNFNKAVQVAKETAPQLYIPTPFSNPTTWGLEGQVTPLERATVDQFNGKSYDWVSYPIQSGDTLSQIASDTLGDASPDAYNWIAQHNGISNPDFIVAGTVIEVPQEVSAPVDNPGPGTSDPGPVITEPGPGTSDPGPVITDPGPGITDPGPVITDPGPGITDPGPGISNPGPTQPSNSINLNGHTVGGNFYPVFQNYQGTLGNPISDVTNYNGASYQKFENGSIVSSQYGTFPLYGGIRQTFLKNGGLEGWLGEPKSGEKGLGNGNIIQYFEDGYIYWNGSKATAYRYGTTLPKTPTNIGNQLGVTKPSTGGNNSGGNTGNDTNPESGGNNGGSNPGGGNLGGDTTIISPGKIISTINFDLKNQSIWSGGQGSFIGGAISDKFNPEWPFGLAKASLEAGYTFSAFANAGTFGVNIPTAFDINWQPNPDGKSVAVNFSPKLNSGLSLETLSGFDLSAKLNLGVKLSTTFPEPWPNRTIGFEASGGLDLQSAMKAAKLPIVLDPSLQSNKKNEDTDNSIETEDVAFQAIDIVNTLALIPATSAAAIPIRDGGFLGASIGINVQQKSKFDVTGFEIDYDDQKNGNELIVNLNNSGTLNVPIPDWLKAGQEFKFTPTIKPLTNFQSFFNLGGKLEGSLNSKKLFESAADKLPVPKWLKDQLKEALPGVSLKEALETPYLSVWQGKIFNPFDFTSAFKLSEINIKIG